MFAAETLVDQESLRLMSTACKLRILPATFISACRRSQRAILGVALESWQNLCGEPGATSGAKTVARSQTLGQHFFTHMTDRHG